MPVHLPHPEIDSQFYDGVPIKRFLAWIIDVCIVFGLLLVALIFTFGLAAIVFPLTLLVLNLAYRTYCLQRWSATIGMRVLGIEIRDKEGDRLDGTAAFFHTAIFIFLFASVIGAVANMVAIIVSDRGQGLHDLILGTAAINTPAETV